ncbi:MAG: tRNA (adenosine(37)-N6)-dimethylallyltransferase MiaA [Chloroflexota bacterium]|nr:tRNA (adenosine(37)-N6)-dimethylallyltransferase MiaA [Chloroflexota bacterium]
MAARKLPVVALTGPTATGKSSAAISIADHFAIEVINSDSRLFYQGMDIGTAKPSVADRAATPHHLLDTLEPHKTMSLAQFQDQATALIGEIHARQRLPMIVGGTQQYINGVVEGWKIPRVPPQPELRNRLQCEADEHGREALLARLERLDPVAATSVGLNTRRIIRALEVIAVTGRPISEQQGKGPVPFVPHLIALTMPRDLLYQRIDARVHEMIEAGLVDEVRALLANGISPKASAFGSIGYRQVVPHIAGTMSLDEMIRRIQHDTHRLVRQQETWLRKAAAIPIDVSNPAWFGTLLAGLREIPDVARYALPERSPRNPD